MQPTVPALLLGLALGATATWHLTRPSASVSAPIINHPSSIINTWSWRDSPAPPLLPGRDIGPAISAWKLLREPDGTTATYLTRITALRALLLRLPSDAYPQLLAALPPPDSAPNRSLRQIAFDGWVALDAPAAARWAVSAGDTFRDLLSQAIRAWAALDALAAATWACSLADPAQAASVAKPALVALAKIAPERALAMAGSREAGFRAEVLPDLVKLLAKNDPAAAVQALAPDAWKNGRGFYDLRDSLRAWALKDPASAIAWLAKQKSQNPDEASRWVSELAETPDELRAFGAIIASTPGYPQLAQTLGQLVFRLGTEPGGGAPAALAWLEEHISDPVIRTDALLSIAGRHPSDHPDLALPLVLALPPSQRRAQALGSLLTAWNKIDSAAALAWMQSQSADPGVAAATARLQAVQLADIARAEPATALAEWKNLSDPRAQKAALHPLAEAWGKTDPAAALRWQTEQAAALGATQFQPSTSLLAAWGKADPLAALRWTEAYLAQTTATDMPWLPQQLFGALGNTWNTATSRSATADLYSKIQDNKLRTQTLTAHVQEWLTKDPAAAKFWLESSSALSPAQAAELLAK